MKNNYLVTENKILLRKKKNLKKQRFHKNKIIQKLINYSVLAKKINKIMMKMINNQYFNKYLKVKLKKIIVIIFKIVNLNKCSKVK